MKWGVLRAEWEFRRAQDPNEKDERRYRLQEAKDDAEEVLKIMGSLAVLCNEMIVELGASMLMDAPTLWTLCRGCLKACHTLLNNSECFKGAGEINVQ